MTLLFPLPKIPADAPQEYGKFWQLWRDEKYFECHEVLENLWRETPSPHRVFLNGLIHGAVAIYQHRRGNAVGAARQLLRAQIKLESFRPKYFEVDIDKFLCAVESEVEPSQKVLSARQREQLERLKLSIRQRIAPELTYFAQETETGSPKE
jgi:predicted metal-dependent hydrolase